LDHSGFSDKTSPCGDHADQLSEERAGKQTPEPRMPRLQPHD
jgi:hypothetical protein